MDIDIRTKSHRCRGLHNKVLWLLKVSNRDIESVLKLSKQIIDTFDRKNFDSFLSWIIACDITCWILGYNGITYNEDTLTSRYPWVKSLKEKEMAYDN